LGYFYGDVWLAVGALPKGHVQEIIDSNHQVTDLLKLLLALTT
jgi:hypothetical protein